MPILVKTTSYHFAIIFPKVK